MRKLRLFFFVLLALGFGFGVAQLAELSKEELSEVIRVTEIIFGELKVVDAEEGLYVLEKSKGGTGPNGKVVESGTVINSTRIVKFKDGRTTCYMLTEEPSGISCVRTAFP